MMLPSQGLVETNSFVYTVCCFVSLQSFDAILKGTHLASVEEAVDFVYIVYHFV